MQEKFNFIYDARNHPVTLTWYYKGLKEKLQIYTAIGSTLHIAYRNNVRIGSVARVGQQKPRLVQTMNQWKLTYNLFESEAYRVSEISIHNIFFSY